MDEETILETIIEKLEGDPTIDSEYIKVSIDDGRIFLEGSVESRDDRKWVEALVNQVTEDFEIVNKIELDPDPGRSYKDLGEHRAP